MGGKLEEEGGRNTPGMTTVVPLKEGRQGVPENTASWMACIPSLPHGCIDNAGTFLGALRRDTLLLGAFLRDTRDKDGSCSHNSISRMGRLGELGGSPVSGERRDLLYGARCTMGLSHLECEELVSFSGRRWQGSTDESPKLGEETIPREPSLTGS